MGALAGWVASMIMKKNRSMGLIANIVVGIVGAFIGGAVMNLISEHSDTGLSFTSVTGWNWPSFLIAVLGSVILLAIINLFTKGKVR